MIALIFVVPVCGYLLWQWRSRQLSPKEKRIRDLKPLPDDYFCPQCEAPRTQCGYDAEHDICPDYERYMDWRMGQLKDSVR